MDITKTVPDVRQHIQNAKLKGKSICLVPTMGGLHKGHTSLIDKAKEIGDYVVVSLFVNPTQFNNPDDLKNYPGDVKHDLEILADMGVDLVFMPSVDEMYPTGHSTQVEVKAGNGIMCDKFRPGHFNGVTQVVTKLFVQTTPDYACFGEKDYQQLFKIKRLSVDLDFPIEIIACETIRESDGLALSSRNSRLTQSERKIAPRLHQALTQTAKKIREGENAEQACEAGMIELNEMSSFDVEYLEYRSQENFDVLDHYQPNGRLFIAAQLGDVRLIDNIPA